MRFPTLSSPHLAGPNSTTRLMGEVLIALVPGVVALVWYFGCGVVRLRGRPVRPAVTDLSAIVTAWLFAVSIPPTLPWWLTVIGILFAIVLVKHLYGGIGHNPFNPAM